MPTPTIQLPTSCPRGLNFGIDHDRHRECDDCNRFAWDECRRWHEDMTKSMSTNPPATTPVARRRGRPPKPKTHTQWAKPANPGEVEAALKQSPKPLHNLPTATTPTGPNITIISPNDDSFDLSKFERVEFDQRYFTTPIMGIRDESISFNSSACHKYKLKDFSCLDIFYHQNRFAIIPTNKDTQFRLKFNKSFCVVTSRRLIRKFKLKPGKYPIQNINGKMLVEVVEK